MAFSTEFVMGAGGGVEEIPVSMSGGGIGSTYPLTTVDAGGGAIVVVAGKMSPGSTTDRNRPQLRIGSYTHAEPHTVLVGQPPGGMIGGTFTGTVSISVLSRSGTATTFSGKVYVARL